METENFQNTIKVHHDSDHHRIGDLTISILKVETAHHTKRQERETETTLIDQRWFTIPYDLLEPIFFHSEFLRFVYGCVLFVHTVNEFSKFLNHTMETEFMYHCG